VAKVLLLLLDAAKQAKTLGSMHSGMEAIAGAGGGRRRDSWQQGMASYHGDALHPNSPSTQADAS
jgi:hypothetical protein